MSKQTLEESEKYHHTYHEEYNDEDLNENYDIESEKDKIVEYSPKQRFVRFNDSLGSGAYKTVYKAYDNETGWEVAWNVIKLQRLPDKERKRISDEIALLKQLKHRNIIHFINAWINRQKEEVVFITEVVTGGSLKKYLKKIRVPRLKIIKSWCREILLGIQYLHQIEPHPIIHRDIKCDNIFINSNNGEIRIGDLGLATFMSHAYADSVLGTPEFMAPEMYEEVYGPSVDIYSFGMCVLEMVTNQTPYSECMNPAQIYKKVSQGIKPNALNLIANEQVKNFIYECLKPKDERPTASDLLQSEFLNTVDPELDNQPVQLYEAPLMPKIEEEDLAKETTKTSLKVEELKQEEDFISETQSEELKIHHDEEKHTLPRQTEEHLMYELKKKAASEKTPSEMQTEKITHSNFKIMNKQKSQEFQEIKPVKIEESKFSSSHDGEHSTKKSQEPALEPGFEDKRKLEVQEIERLKQERRQLEKSMVKTYSQTSLNKDINQRYTFISKGIVNSNLTIYVKSENPNPQFDPVVEIQKEKIRAEKIKRKLFKKLELSNQNDPYFNQQINALFDTLCAQNIIQGPIVNYQLSWGARSITNESQKSPDRSVVTTNPNSVFFQSAYFYKCYKKYMSKVPKEYLMQESDDVMNLRHQREIMELENFHLAQKRNMWDRRQGVMSNSVAGSNHNGYQPTTADPDDYYHRVFQFQDVSYKSDNKKKSRCTDMSISSVDSVTLSPTCSSGNNIQSISNWADANPANFKKDETPINTLDDIHKIPLVDADIEKHTTSNQAIDTTPKEQHPVHHHTPGSGGNGASHKPATGSATTSSKHSASNFATQAGKATVNKIQQNVNPERKTPEIQERIQDQQQQQQPTGKRLSIEKNLESGQKLTQAIITGQMQSPQTSTIAKQQQNEGEKPGEGRKETKPPLINTSSPPEKGYNYSQPILEIGNQTPTPQAKTQQTSQSQPIIRQPETPVVGQAQVNNGTFTQQANIQHHHQAEHHYHQQNTLPNLTVPKHVPQNQAWPNQPHSATVKNTQPLLNQAVNQPVSGGTPKPTTSNQGNPVLNSNAQKTSLPTHNSLGSFQAAKIGGQSSGGSFKIPKNSVEVPKVNSFNTNTHEMSQSTYKKLQSTELLEKIKTYKIKGALKRYSDMDIEDVKMLQTCLELLTENDILSNGHFSHYTENLIKSCQESLGVPADGVVDELVWEKMQNALEKKVEKKRLAKEARTKETNDSNKNVDDIKKKMKDKQNKEASECLTKIESNLLNLSDLK